MSVSFTHLDGSLHKHRSRIVDPLRTQMQHRMVTLLLCFCYILINFLPTWQTWISRNVKSSGKGRDLKRDENTWQRAERILHRELNKILIVYIIPQWNLLAYFPSLCQKNSLTATTRLTSIEPTDKLPWAPVRKSSHKRTPALHTCQMCTINKTITAAISFRIWSDIAPLHERYQNVSLLVLWVVAPCALVDRCQWSLNTGRIT